MKDNWDPQPGERTYYRCSADGQRGYLVRRRGKDSIRLDRPMEEIIKPLDGTWQPDIQNHPLTLHQVTSVAFAADRALCRVMGVQLKKHEYDWLSMREQDRIQFMEDGPSTGDIREDLYDAIMGSLKSMTDGG